MRPAKLDINLLKIIFERTTELLRVNFSVPNDFSFGEIKPDWDRMTPFLEKAMSRVPITQEIGIKKFFCGPESFTPDLQSIVGEAPELRNYFVAAGLNSIGILAAGGLGRIMAHWIINGWKTRLFFALAPFRQLQEATQWYFRFVPRQIYALVCTTLSSKWMMEPMTLSVLVVL